MPTVETQSKPQPIRSLNGSSFSTGAREEQMRVASRAARWGTCGLSVSAMDEQTGHPADHSGPNMKW